MDFEAVHPGGDFQVHTALVSAAGSLDSIVTPGLFEVYEPGPLEVDGQLISHNIWVQGHRTSVRLEAVMWAALGEIAKHERTDVNVLVTFIAGRRAESASLTATVRAFLLAYYREFSPPDPDRRLLTGFLPIAA